MSSDVDFLAIARAAAGASGAELANMINEAALRAVRSGRDIVTQADLEESVEVVIAGYQKKNKILSDHEKMIVSYHEIGHALSLIHISLAVPYLETMTVSQDIWDRIEAMLPQTDLFLVMCYRIPKLERYRKTTVVFSNGNEGADVCAYYRSIGVEAYNAIDIPDLNEILHAMWVRDVYKRQG